MKGKLRKIKNSQKGNLKFDILRHYMLIILLTLLSNKTKQSKDTMCLITILKTQFFFDKYFGDSRYNMK